MHCDMAFSVVIQDQLFCTVFQEFLDKHVDLLLLLQAKTPYGQTINQQGLRNLKSCSYETILYHDNAFRNTAISIKQRNIPVVPQPSYSPDLSPCDFMFPSLKNCLK